MEQEQRALAMLGLAALAALGILAWQRWPLDVTRAAVLSERSELKGGTARWDRALEDARRLDVNAADAAALERLPEVGPALAWRIVDDRRLHGRFHDPEELMRVKGIGPKTLGTLKEYIAVNE